MRFGLSAVLFDFDGTLVDSAPDLAASANFMRAVRGYEALPYATLRPHAGSGARGMLSVAFGIEPADAGYNALRDEFLDDYERRMLGSAQLFEGIASMLDALDAHGVPWGIVTNKALRFADPMARALALWPRAGALVGGDSTPHTKPHPAPLLEGARRLRCSPRQCMYVGDDHRDIRAGKAAGMRTAAAAWGYLGVAGDPRDWAADTVSADVADLLQSLDLP